MVAIKKFKLFIINVTIKNIAKIIAATRGGHFKIFCKAIDIIIVAIGKAKNTSKGFMFSLSFLLYFMHYFFIWLTKFYSYSTFTKYKPCGGNVFPAFSLF